MTLTQAILLIAAAVAVTMWFVRDKTFKAPPTVLLYGLVIAGGMVYSSQRADAENLRTHDQCVARVERSAGNRTYNLTLIGVIQRELPNRPDIAAELIAALDENLPPLSVDDC